jgi:hypothetical protein
MTDGFSTIIEFNPNKNIGVVVLGNVFNASSIESLGNVAITGADTYQVIKITPDFLTSVAGQYLSGDNKTEMDISAFRQSFLPARLTQDKNTASVRLLSLADPIRFALDSQTQVVTSYWGNKMTVIATFVSKKESNH